MSFQEKDDAIMQRFLINAPRKLYRVNTANNNSKIYK